MTSSRHLPENYDRFAEVGTEDEFFARPLTGRVNLVWMPRTIFGDYDELARQLYIVTTWCEQMMTHRDAIRTKLENIATCDDAVGQAARQVMEDQDWVIRRGLRPDFRIAGPDFYEYAIYQPHMDIGDEADEFGTFSCGYTQPVTGLARNEDATFSYATRLDRVYSLKPGAETFHPGVGDVFRMAAYQNKNKVEGVVHWAHPVRSDRSLRMLLMARYSY